MAKRRKATSKKKFKTAVELAEESGAFVFDFVGGPRRGARLRLAWPPSQYVRLGLPTFATYEYDDIDNCYVYLGTELPPSPEQAEEERVGPVEVPFDLERAALLEALKQTEPWFQGRALAEENERLA